VFAPVSSAYEDPPTAYPIEENMMNSPATTLHDLVHLLVIESAGRMTTWPVLGEHDG
jgi:hypothetical protein